MRSGRKGSLLRYETAAKNIRKGKRSFADVFCFIGILTIFRQTYLLYLFLK